MTNKKLYNYRKENGLCVNCGERRDGGTATRCLRCAQIERVKAHDRYERLTPEEKKHNYFVKKKWLQEHPEKVAEYAKRKSEYNRRYKEKYEW